MGKARIHTAGLIRHVMARGNGRMQIFLDDNDYHYFVFLLGEVIEEYDIECWNYCLMPNHCHATLSPTRPNLSEAMQKLLGEYGKWWNRRHSRVGHVLQGRFKDQIVQREGYLLALTRYVALNPVRAGLCERPEDWPWSSYAAIAGLRPPLPFLAVDSTLGLFAKGDGAEKARARFVEFVTSMPEDPAVVERFRSNAPILGDKAFKQTVGALRRPDVPPSSPQPPSTPHAGSDPS